MEKKIKMTLEEAIEFQNNKYPYKDWKQTEERYIKLALENYNYKISTHAWQVKNTLRLLEEYVNKVEDFTKLDIRFEPIEEFIKSDRYSIKFNAWSDTYVYVRGTYDGSDWIEAIDRNPSNDLTNIIGGG